MPTVPPQIHKLGTIDCDMVETTPVVFRDRLYRFEYVRADYHANETGESYFRFVDVASGQPTPAFATGYHLGSAFVHDDTAYVYGVDSWGGDTVQVFWSRDLENWESSRALISPRWKLYNTSVCRGPDRFIMAVEVGEPSDVVGVAFTNRFAESQDLVNWTLLPSECVFSKDRYTACPAIRFVDGYYYIIYLESRPGPTYESHIVRSPDLVRWGPSGLNPVMGFSSEDKRIANSRLTAAQQQRIATAVNINNSDIDLCEFEGRVVLNYSWGNQKRVEFLAQAEWPGSLLAFLEGYFPGPE
jgi:hypothetical protein